MKAACAIKEKLNANGEPECKTDEDCTGKRICDDATNVCEGNDTGCE